MPAKKDEKLPNYASRSSVEKGDYVSVCLRKILSDNASSLSINFEVPHQELEERLKKIKELFKKTW